jgi:hypothetical protein
MFIYRRNFDENIETYTGSSRSTGCTCSKSVISNPDQRLRFITQALETAGRLVYKTEVAGWQTLACFLPDNQRNCRGLNES